MGLVMEMVMEMETGHPVCTHCAWFPHPVRVRVAYAPHNQAYALQQSRAIVDFLSFALVVPLVFNVLLSVGGLKKFAA